MKTHAQKKELLKTTIALLYQMDAIEAHRNLNQEEKELSTALEKFLLFEKIFHLEEEGSITFYPETEDEAFNQELEENNPWY